MPGGVAGAQSTMTAPYADFRLQMNPFRVFGSRQGPFVRFVNSFIGLMRVVYELFDTDHPRFPL